MPPRTGFRSTERLGFPFFFASYKDQLRGASTLDPSKHVSRRQRARLSARTRLPDDHSFASLIREEENIQRLALERQGIIERILDPSPPASARFIARFRRNEETMPKLCGAVMAREETKCSVCLEYLKVDESYATWPCYSRIPHQFHSDCMLKCLRKKHTCPLCRHPVEANINPIPYPYLPAFLSRYA